MDKIGITSFLIVLLTSSVTHAIWTCESNEDCSELENGVCYNGACGCAAGKQLVFGNQCVDIAPYFFSSCYETHQCSRLFPGHQCDKLENESLGSCTCLPGYHYHRGRCWLSKDFGESCSVDEECFNSIRDPLSLACVGGTCECGPGYYFTQRGHCRKGGYRIGEGCLLDLDCQFENGLCDPTTLTCYDSTATVTTRQNIIANTNYTTNLNTRNTEHSLVCDLSTPCPDTMECSAFGVCVCSNGYYQEVDEDGVHCYAELGSPATEDSCVGRFAIVENGICGCPANFFYDQNMRDCVKGVISITHSCIQDEMCYTFGTATFCGDPQEPWGLRSCECKTEEAVWDAQLNICRLFAGIGEVCEIDSDCMAGNLEILCSTDAEGVGRCTCPTGMEAVGGLCLNAGLGLGETCQVSQECSGASNAECTQGVCSCTSPYQQVGDYCAPAIGGSCQSSTDCIISNTACLGDDSTCQCVEGYVQYEETCWPVQPAYNASCEVTAQCATQGVGSICLDNVCVCSDDYHYKDGGCWPRIGLFDYCSRVSECYLPEASDRVVCRNGMCQCDFDYPYSEELQTCGSSSTAVYANIVLIICAVMKMVMY